MATAAANNTSGQTQAPSPAKVKLETLTAKVNSVTSEHSMNGERSQITLEDEAQENTTFLVAKDATITDKDGSTVTVNWIMKGDKVTIRFVTNENGTKTIRSIKILPGW